MNIPNISGRFSTPKPWQIAVGAALVIFVVIVGPAINHVMVGEKKKPETKNLNSVGRIGEPWHPAAFPVPMPRQPQPEPQPQPQAQTSVPPPPPPPSFTPNVQRSALAATNRPGKEVVDPEIEAINAPITIAAPPGQVAQAPPATVKTERTQAEGNSALNGLLKPTELSGFKAERMQHRDMTIGEGRIIQCHSITRMTSGLQGLVRAKIARDVWSEDDTVRLIERDSFIFGEIQHGMIAGVDRMFVLWRRIETPRPNLVRITLNSPAADEMGESGLTGDVDRHWGTKIGGALMLSGIESMFSGLSGALSNIGRGSGNSQTQGLNLNFGQVGSQGSTLAEELLRHTIEIPDTLTVNPAAPCSIFAASDLDFSSVYDVRKK